MNVCVSDCTNYRLQTNSLRKRTKACVLLIQAIDVGSPRPGREYLHRFHYRLELASVLPQEARLRLLHVSVAQPISGIDGTRMKGNNHRVEYLTSRNARPLFNPKVIVFTISKVHCCLSRIVCQINVPHSHILPRLYHCPVRTQI